MFTPFIEKVPYSNIKDNALTPKKKISVIRNFTLEPHFEHYMGYYAPNVDITYLYFDMVLHNNMIIETDAIIILHLPFVLNDFYFHLYAENDENKKLALVQEQINSLDKLLCRLISLVNPNNTVYFALFANTEKYKALHGQICFDNVSDEINKRIFKHIDSFKNLRLIDTPSVMEQIGFNNYYDLVGKYNTESVLTKNAINRIAFKTSSMMYRNKYDKKCIILDCDNVLWGGTLDEVGYDGIVLSNNGIGLAYKEFQREILKLKEQGYIICICSKNHLKHVKEVFSNHPDMVLKWDDLTAYRVSFTEKEKSIYDMSNELNMPLEEMVFVDDNHFEIQSANTSLGIDTIWFNSKQPHKYIDFLYESGFFSKYTITVDDSNRTQRYKSTVETSRLGLNANKVNKILNTTIEIRDAKPLDLQRISELSFRTHQFNMSGIKYNLDALETLHNASNYKIFCMNVKDNYGNLGIIAAAIVSTNDNKAIIESLFISCRVLGRNFEYELIKYIKNHIKKDGIQSLKAIYHETESNKKFKNFYSSLGIIII